MSNHQDGVHCTCTETLRKLKTMCKEKKLSDGKGLDGVGRLNEVKIDTLQNYFGLAIRQNVADIIGMQNKLMASLYHVCSNNENPNRRQQLVWIQSQQGHLSACTWAPRSYRGTG